jgi:hypothetical protein
MPPLALGRWRLASTRSLLVQGNSRPGPTNWRPVPIRPRPEWDSWQAACPRSTRRLRRCPPALGRWPTGQPRCRPDSRGCRPERARPLPVRRHSRLASRHTPRGLTGSRHVCCLRRCACLLREPVGPRAQGGRLRDGATGVSGGTAQLSGLSQLSLATRWPAASTNSPTECPHWRRVCNRPPGRDFGDNSQLATGVRGWPTERPTGVGATTALPGPMS